MIDIEIEDLAWGPVEGPVREAAAAALAETVGSVIILLTDDAAVRALNAQFRGKDSPTNVLSFPAAPNREDHLGDIALALQTCAAEAADQGKPFEHHVRHLVIHGVLHLLGYDHQDEDSATQMETLERGLLERFGIADPYELTGHGHLHS